MPNFVPDREPRVLNQLAAIVGQSCGDPVFRRQLRYRPAEALDAAGLGIDGVPESLPIRHDQVSVSFEPDVLFGPVGFAGPCDHRELPVEVRLVRFGLKPLALVAGSADEVFAIASSARALGLVVLLSHDEFTPLCDPVSNGYVHCVGGQRPARSGSAGCRRLLAGRDWRRVELGWLSLVFGWDEFLGVLLGYPRCCVRAYSANWQEACRDYSGEVAAVLLKQATQDADGQPGVVRAAHWGMNLFGRYFGDHLIEHFPCGFGCAATASLADATARGLRDFEPELCAALERSLSAPVLFVPGEGSFLLRDAAWEAGGGALHYDGAAMVASNPESLVCQKLRGLDSLAVGREGISLGAEQINGWLLDFPAQPGQNAALRGASDDAVF